MFSVHDAKYFTMMIHLQSYGFLVVLLCFVSGVLTQQNGGYYECSPWKDGNIVSITFHINRTNFPSECAVGVTGQPLFRMRADDTAIRISNCTVPEDIRVSGSCSFQPGTLGCGCTAENDGGYFRAEYNFIADPTYHRWWDASISCLDSNVAPALSFTGTGCEPIPDETTGQTTTESSGRDSGTSDEGEIGGIVGGVIGAVAAICVIAVIAYLVYRKKKAGQPCNRTDVPRNANGNSGGPPCDPTDVPRTANGNSSGASGEKPLVYNSGNDRGQ